LAGLTLSVAMRRQPRGHHRPLALIEIIAQIGKVDFYDPVIRLPILTVEVDQSAIVNPAVLPCFWWNRVVLD
jgi:hypothetical protein